MNVLYAGVKNPIEVIVPGIDDKDIVATLSGPGVLGRDSTFPHYYYAYVIEPGKCEIYVAARINGKITAIGSQELRIKKIPDPIVVTNGYLKSGGVPVDKMKKQMGIMCLLSDFEFECKFPVIGYTMVFISNGKIFKASATDAHFTAEMKRYLDTAKPGDVVFFEDVTVMIPDNQVRKLNTVAYYLQ